MGETHTHSRMRDTVRYYVIKKSNIKQNFTSLSQHVTPEYKQRRALKVTHQTFISGPFPDKT